MPVAAAPDYLLPYLSAAEKYGAGFGTLLWASPRTQAARFQALLRAFDVNGKTVLDVGCGRADLLEFMFNSHVIPRRYIGLEAVETLAAAAGARRLPGCRIIRGDFLRNPELLAVGADVLYYSGSLNTMDEADFYDCLRAGFAAARGAVVFNFLAGPKLAAAPHLTWHRAEDVLAFARTLSSRVRMIDDYLSGDCTIAIGKETP